MYLFICIYARRDEGMNMNVYFYLSQISIDLGISGTLE